MTTEEFNTLQEENQMLRHIVDDLTRKFDDLMAKVSELEDRVKRCEDGVNDSMAW